MTSPLLESISLDPRVPYRELRDPPLPEPLRALALACFTAERRAAVECGRAEVNGRAKGASRASCGDFPEAVSDEALARLLASGQTVGGIVTHRGIATALPFNARHTRAIVRSVEVAACRRRLDRAFARWIRTALAGAERVVLSPAGLWWYPPGTSFGWHTNEAYPGWRLYLSHAEEHDRSCFRYRDPTSGAVVTSRDGRWHLRCFRVSREEPLWHAIHSETHRFSIGWRVRPRSVRNLAAVQARRLLDRLALPREA